MNWINGIMVLLKLIGIAEEGAAQAKIEGSVKKASVMSFFMTLFGGVASQVTGGAADTMKGIEPMIGTFIDQAVSLANVTSKLAGGQDVVKQDNIQY